MGLRCAFKWTTNFFCDSTWYPGVTVYLFTDEQNRVYWNADNFELQPLGTKDQVTLGKMGLKDLDHLVLSFVQLYERTSDVNHARGICWDLYKNLYSFLHDYQHPRPKHLQTPPNISSL